MRTPTLLSGSLSTFTTDRPPFPEGRRSHVWSILRDWATPGSGPAPRTFATADASVCGASGARPRAARGGLPARTDRVHTPPALSTTGPRRAHTARGFALRTRVSAAPEVPDGRTRAGPSFLKPFPDREGWAAGRAFARRGPRTLEVTVQLLSVSALRLGAVRHLLSFCPSNLGDSSSTLSSYFPSLIKTAPCPLRVR